MYYNINFYYYYDNAFSFLLNFNKHKMVLTNIQNEYISFINDHQYFKIFYIYYKIL